MGAPVCYGVRLNYLDSILNYRHLAAILVLLCHFDVITPEVHTLETIHSRKYASIYYVYNNKSISH